jgi:hypothetical protein
MSNQNAILPLTHAYQHFTKLIDVLSNEQFLSLLNGWTPRDVVAHLIGWNGLMIESALSILAGNLPSYYDDAPNDYSNINASFTAKYSSQSKQELLAELQSSMENFEQFICALPIEELKANHGVMHHSGSPATITKIIDSLAGDYQYHTHQIEEWLNQR